MSDAAVAFARAIGYRERGTAEFMLDGRDFFFLELNARIQVEHPVTELVTGVDLVARAAPDRRRASRSTPRAATCAGHAVEVRLYAEDPRTFLPQAGTDRAAAAADRRSASTPASRRATRSAPRYDPMIAKLIAHGRDARRGARPARAPRSPRPRSTASTTNLPFLRWLVAHPALPRRRDDDRVPHRAPAALRAAAARCRDGPWRGAFRLNLPAPPPAAAARRRRGRARRTARRRAEHGHRADARHGDPRARRARATRSSARQPLVVLEAMKMETPLVSPYEATVRAVHVAEGDRVAGGAVLVELEE